MGKKEFWFLAIVAFALGLTGVVGVIATGSGLWFISLGMTVPVVGYMLVKGIRSYREGVNESMRSIKEGIDEAISHNK